jgi:ribose 5-phosphate isomerase RpiB
MIQVGVFRIFGDELQKPVLDTDVALQLHNNRKQALHDVFDNQQGIEVADWGQTDDSQPHEFVSIAVGIGATVVANHVLIPAAKFIFEKLADKAIDTVLEKSVSWILSKFKKKQEEKKIGRFEIRLPNGTVLFVDKPEQGGKIKFTVNGKWEEIEF